jgi:hypothetical protein
MISASLASASDTTKTGTLLDLTNAHIREVQLSLDLKHLPKTAMSLIIEKSLDGINFELVKIIPISYDALPIIIADHLTNDQGVFYRVIAGYDELHSEVLEVAHYDPERKFEIEHETAANNPQPWLLDPHLIQ